MEPVGDQINHITPRFMAIVVVSLDYAGFTGRTLKYLLKHGYKGKIHPMNPDYYEIVELKYLPSIEALSESVDTAFIQVPSRAVVSGSQKATIVLGTAYKSKGTYEFSQGEGSK